MDIYIYIYIVGGGRLSLFRYRQSGRISRARPRRRLHTVYTDDCMLAIVCVYSVWVPWVALPSGSGFFVGFILLCGFFVWFFLVVFCVVFLCGFFLCEPLVWVPCVGPLLCCVSCGNYSRDVSCSFIRSRSAIVNLENLIWRWVGGSWLVLVN